MSAVTLWVLLLLAPFAGPLTASPEGSREPRETPQARQQLGEPRRHPRRPPPPPPRPLPHDAEARRAERERLKREIAELRLRLEEAGNSEAGRRRPTWWDLHSRRQQGLRLRHLGRLRRELDWRLDRLERLKLEEGPPPPPDRKAAGKEQ